MSQKEVIVIFGATGGIGSRLALELKNQDKEVILCSRNQEKLELLSKDLNLPFYVCEATKEESVKQVFDDIYRKYQKIDAVANCIGCFFIKPLEKTTLKEFNDVLQINLFTSFIITKEAVEKMSLNKKGSILLFSSSAAQLGLVHHEAISAAKGAISSFVRSAAASYAPKNIRINALCPGLIDTNLAKPITSNEGALKTSIGFHPLGRIGTVDDISAIASLLLSDQSSFITAQNISVDGGLIHIKTRNP
jgi:NAD(P)-dependent dehydrogenase (short-subunit alcohol dehydrogenase family)